MIIGRSAVMTCIRLRLICWFIITIVFCSTVSWIIVHSGMTVPTIHGPVKERGCCVLCLKNALHASTRNWSMRRSGYYNRDWLPWASVTGKKTITGNLVSDRAHAVVCCSACCSTAAWWWRKLRAASGNNRAKAPASIRKVEFSPRVSLRLPISGPLTTYPRRKRRFCRERILARICRVQLFWIKLRNTGPRKPRIAVRRK